MAAKSTAKSKKSNPATPRAKAVGRKCSVCTHTEVGQINTAIAQGVSFRGISLKYGMSDMSIQRHTQNCLQKNIAAELQQHKAKQAIDVIAEFEEQLAFAKALRIAAQEYLSDPADPLKIAIVPFAHEIDVAFFDMTDLVVDKSGNEMPKKKTAKLSNLLTDVEKLRNVEVDKFTFKHVDLRTFALEAVKTVDLCLDKFAKIAGIYQNPQKNKKDLELTIEAINSYLEKHPDHDKSEVIKAFAEGRNVPVEAIASQLGVIG